jgi:methanogenic corrinoid protein MtbC1
MPADDPAPLDEVSPASASIATVLRGARDGDADGIRAALDEVCARVGLGALLDDVVMPSMRQVGALWELGRCDVEQAQLTSEIVRGWLADRPVGASAPRSEGRVLLSVGPRDQHTLGVEALATLLRELNVGVRTLGPGTSVSSLVTTTLATQPDAVVVVSHLSTQRRSAVDALEAVAQTGTVTFYAGNAFTAVQNRNGVPGTYLGEILTGAAERIRHHLERRPR